MGATAAGAGCFWAAWEFELLSLLPPQLATPTAMRRIAAMVARKVIGLLRFMMLLGFGNQGGSLPRGRLSSARGRHLCLQPER